MGCLSSAWQLTCRTARSARQNLMLSLTLLGVILGCIVGIILAMTGAIAAEKGEKPTVALRLIGFPGEILLRMLTALVLPLISASIVVGIASTGGPSPWERQRLKREKKMLRRRRRPTLEEEVPSGAGSGDDRALIDKRALPPAPSFALDADSASQGEFSNVHNAASHSDAIKKSHDLNNKKDSQLTRSILLRTVTFFALTTLIAVVIGIILSASIQPGTFAQPVQPNPLANITNHTTDRPIERPDALESILDVFRSMFPDNLVRAAAEMDILGVIVFSLVLGFVLVSMGEHGEPMLDVFFSLNEAIMKIVMLVMWYAPIGICSLITARIGENEDFVELFLNIAMFAVTVISGLVIHFICVVSIAYFIVLRKNPLKYYYGLVQAIVTGLGTDSSAATMPITMKCVIEQGISEQIAQIVLPLGVTLNMNGTALYEAVAAIFVAQLNGIHLEPGQYIIIALTSTLAAAGAAGIPEAGLITMALVFSAVGLPLTDIALLLTIDWLLDRLRTVVNILSDAVCCAIVDELHQRHTRSIASITRKQADIEAEAGVVALSGVPVPLDSDDDIEGERAALPDDDAEDSPSTS